MSMDLLFRETLPSDIDGLFSVRARTRENPISKEGLASIGITSDSIAKQMAGGRVKGWVCLHGSTLVGFCNGDGGFTRHENTGAWFLPFPWMAAEW